MPNPVGYIPTLVYFNDTPTAGQKVGTGVFSNSSFENNAAPGTTAHTGAGINNTALNFSAAKNQAVFGASNTVQPPAISLIPQIRY